MSMTDGAPGLRKGTGAGVDGNGGDTEGRSRGVRGLRGPPGARHGDDVDSTWANRDGVGGCSPVAGGGRSGGGDGVSAPVDGGCTALGAAVALCAAAGKQVTALGRAAARLQSGAAQQKGRRCRAQRSQRRRHGGPRWRRTRLRQPEASRATTRSGTADDGVDLGTGGK
ncbi:hypothetical protein E2562_037976 [Oryza meyeriana var. granulata]|uniref:Uncharacterized protein n=1 Tax=Oryza meyeriana var. granulata TaxID=110450 RepID=A0A6G1CLV2_9ORYZ|nr:hypothetical protein E2562_037976 [Oryza meyeriana var. granulata]